MLLSCYECLALDSSVVLSILKTRSRKVQKHECGRISYGICLPRWKHPDEVYRRTEWFSRSASLMGLSSSRDYSSLTVTSVQLPKKRFSGGRQSDSSELRN